MSRPISRSRTRKVVWFPLGSAARFQPLLLHVPEVCEYIHARQRETLLIVAVKLIEQGWSMNGTARFLGLSTTWLSVHLRSYAGGGFRSLLPRRRNRSRGPSACALGVWLEQ